MIGFLREKKADIFFILFFLLLFVLATTLMPHISIKAARYIGSAVKPDVLLGGVISLGLLRGKKYASYYAVIFGFVFDLYIGNPYAFSPLVFFLSAYFASSAATPFSRKTPLSVLIISSMLLWMKALVSFFYLIATSSGEGALKLLVSGVLPEYAVNILVTAAVFTLMRILMAIFRIPVREDIGG